MYAFRVLLFIGGFVAIVVLLNKQYDAMYRDFTAYQFHELFHSNDPRDTIILGSSTALHGYDPAILGRVYNFGMLGAQPHFYLSWYKIFEMYYPKPKTVIVSLDWFSAGTNRGDPVHEEVELTQDSRYLPISVVLPMFWTADFENKVMILANLVRILGIGTDTKYLFIPRKDPSMDGYNHGYMPLYGDIDLSQQGPRNFVMNDAFLSDLESLLEEIQSQGSKVVLVEVPTYKPEEIHNLNDSAIAEIAKKHNIPFLDYNRNFVSALNEDASMFGDWSHLNRQGSTIFSMMFREDLRKDNLLKWE